MVCGFPETCFPKLRPASNSMMADTYGHGFVAGGEDRHTIQSQRHRRVSTMCQTSSSEGGDKDAIVPTFSALQFCGFCCCC